MSEIAEWGTLEVWSSSVRSTEGCLILPLDCTNLRLSALEATSEERLFVFFSVFSLAPADGFVTSLEGDPVEHLSL